MGILHTGSILTKQCLYLISPLLPLHALTVFVNLLTATALLGQDMPMADSPFARNDYPSTEKMKDHLGVIV
jgi:hypothetical protein